MPLPKSMAPPSACTMPDTLPANKIAAIMTTMVFSLTVVIFGK